MIVQCPQCGSRFLKPLPAVSVREWLRTLAGVSPLVCGDCKARFVARTWSLDVLRYARCPRCFRMDLATLHVEDHEPGNALRFWMAVGAKAYRCEYCRVNFASFRGRKERFSHERWRKLAEERDKPERR